MTPIELLVCSPWAPRIGMTLLHFLWQGTAIALVLAIVLWLLRRRSPQARWLASCTALALMVAAPLATVWLVAPEPPASIDPGPVVSAGVPAEDPAMVSLPRLPAVEGGQGWTLPEPVPSATAEVAPLDPVTTRDWSERAYELVQPALPWVAFGWVIGVAGLVLWHLGGWVQLHRLKRRRTRPASQAVREMVGRLARMLRVARPVRVLESALARAPVVIGWLRPVVLLPVSTLAGVTPAQLEAILAHELAHIRRYDCLVCLVQVVAETLLFYHPAVWWVSRRIRTESEYCCDEIAAEVCGDRKAYARAMATVAELASATPPLAVAATGGSVLARIRRVLRLPESDHGLRPGWLAGMLVLAAMVTGGVIVVGCMGNNNATTTGQVTFEGQAIDRAEQWPPPLEAKALGGAWLRERTKSENGAGDPDYELMILHPDGPWAHVSLWGTPEKPSRVQLVNQGPAWQCYQHPEISTPPRLIRWTDAGRTGSWGFDVPIAILEPGRVIFAGWAVNRPMVAEYRRCDVSLWRSLSASLAGTTAPKLDPYPPQSDVSWPGPLDASRLVGTWFQPREKEPSPFLILRADRSWVEGSLVGTPKDVAGVKVYRSGRQWDLRRHGAPWFNVALTIDDAGSPRSIARLEPSRLDFDMDQILQGVIVSSYRRCDGEAAASIERAASRAAEFTEATITVFDYSVVPLSKWQTTVNGPEALGELLAFFPDLGRKSDRAAGWMAGAQVELKKAGGETVRVTLSSNDKLTVWSEGHGDWPVRGDIAAYVERLRAAGVAEKGKVPEGKKATAQPDQTQLRELAEQVFAAVKAGDDKQADELMARNVPRGFWDSERKRLDFSSLSLRDVYADESAALVTSNALPDTAEHQHFILMEMTRKDGRWMGRRLERTTADNYQRILSEFLSRHPQATTQPAEEWGEAVEGVAVRLRAEKVAWKAGEVPALSNDFRNQGTRDLRLVPAPEYRELELDGNWYRPSKINLGDVPVKPFGPGSLHEGVVLLLDERWGWQSKEGNRPLTFSPGKHTVRVAFEVHPAKDGEGKPIRAVSNAVEIEILPAEAGPTADVTLILADEKGQTFTWRVARREPARMIYGVLEEVDGPNPKRIVAAYDGNAEKSVKDYTLVLGHEGQKLRVEIGDQYFPRDGGGEGATLDFTPWPAGAELVPAWRNEATVLKTTGYTLLWQGCFAKDGQVVKRVALIARLAVQDDPIQHIFGKGDAVRNILPSADAETAWGKAVEGVQVRLRAEKTQWKAGEIPALLLDSLNHGRESLQMVGNSFCEMEVDGRWYYRVQAGTLDLPPFTELEPGGSHGDYRIPTGMPWGAKELPEVKLEWTPGKHKVRVSLLGKASKSGKEIHAVSNAVEIEILPAEAKVAWGEAVNGLATGLSLNLGNRSYRMGEMVTFDLHVRNVGDQAVMLQDSVPGIPEPGRTFHLKGWHPDVRDVDGKLVPVAAQPDHYQVEARELKLQPGEGAIVGTVGLKLDNGPEDRPQDPHVYLVPGRYRVSQVYRFRESPQATWSGELTSGELTLTVVEREPVAGQEVKKAPAWGEAAEGVQVRLANYLAQWPEGRSICFQADFRNQGRRSLTVRRTEFEVAGELELDGQWHRRSQDLKGKDVSFASGEHYEKLQFNLRGDWVNRDTGLPLKLPTLGKHTVRVALLCQPNEKGVLEPLPQPVRAVSNAIEFEVIPEEIVEFYNACKSLRAGAPRDEVARRFAAIAERWPEPRLKGFEVHFPGLRRTVQTATELAGQFRAMAEEDRAWKAPQPPLTEKQNVAVLIYRLRDVAETAIFIPGKVQVLKDAKADNPARALANLGTAVVPDLLPLLADRRPTRSADQPLNGNHVLRYCDVALQILERIATGQDFFPDQSKAPFDPRPGRNQYLGNADEKARAEIIARVNAWWAAEQKKPAGVKPAALPVRPDYVQACRILEEAGKADTRFWDAVREKDAKKLAEAAQAMHEQAKLLEAAMVGSGLPVALVTEKARLLAQTAATGDFTSAEVAYRTPWPKEVPQDLYQTIAARAAEQQKLEPSGGLAAGQLAAVNRKFRQQLTRTPYMINDATGQPIPEAHVSLWPAGFRREEIPGAATLAAHTDADGRLVIDTPASPAESDAGAAAPESPGSPGVAFALGSMEHPRYGRAPVEMYLPGHPGSKVFTSLTAEGSEARRRAATGRVVDGQGRPVAGALVTSTEVDLPPHYRRPGNAAALTANDGTFTLYLTQYIGNGYSPSYDGETTLLPEGTRYALVIHPAGHGFFPRPARLLAAAPEDLVVSKPSLPGCRLAFESETGGLTDDPAELAHVHVTYSPEGRPRDTVTLGTEWVTGTVNLMPGLYGAWYDSGTGRMFEFEPRRVGPDDAGRQLIFRRRASATYHGRVVDGVTGQPISGALVFGYWALKTGNLALLTDAQWRALEALPVYPARVALDAPAVQALDEHYSLETLARTDGQGRYEITHRGEDRFSTCIVVARDRLPVAVRVIQLPADPASSAPRAAVPDVPLFPAAYATVRPDFSGDQPPSTLTKWQLQDDGRPAWFDRFRRTMSDPLTGFMYAHWLKPNEAQRVYVPSGVPVRLTFDTPYDAKWTPEASDQVLRLEPGQTVEFGAIRYLASLRMPVEVVDEEGRPLEGIPVGCKYEPGVPGSWQTVHTAADGRADVYARPGTAGLLRVLLDADPPTQPFAALPAGGPSAAPYRFVLTAAQLRQLRAPAAALDESRGPPPAEPAPAARAAGDDADKVPPGKAVEGVEVRLRAEKAAQELSRLEDELDAVTKTGRKNDTHPTVVALRERIVYEKKMLQDAAGVQSPQMLARAQLAYATDQLVKLKEALHSATKVRRMSEEHPEVIALQKRIAHFEGVIQEATAVLAADDSAWGQAVEGVQVWLRAEKRGGKAGEMPVLLNDFRNQGTRDLSLVLAPEYRELELDGNWYRPTKIDLGRVPVKPFGPGSLHEGVVLSLDERWGWKSKEGNKPLIFSPGKHTVRVAFEVQPAKDGDSAPVRAVSNAVKIEVLPAEAKPAEKAAAEAARFLALAVVRADIGAPLPGTSIALKVDGNETPLATDKDGRCMLPVPGGELKSFSLTASRDGFARTYISWREEDRLAEIPAEYTLTLEPGTTVGGVVQDEQGRPIPGVVMRVWIHARQEGPGSVRRNGGTPVNVAPTDGQGRWQYDAAPKDLQERDVSIDCRHPDYIGFDAFMPGGLIRDLRNRSAITVLRRGVKLSGTVVDAQGRPVAGARLHLGREAFRSRRAAAGTNTKGQFEFRPEVPGPNVLSVLADGCSPTVQDILLHDGLAPLAIRLTPGRTVRFRVVDVQGRPIEDAYLSAVRWGEHRCLEVQGRTDAEGRYRWDAAPAAGEVTFRVQKDGLLTQEVTLQAGEAEQVVAMHPVLKVRGTVTDAETGRPVESFRLILGHGAAQGTEWQRLMAVSLTGGRYEVAIDSLTFLSSPDRYQWAELRDNHCLRIEAAGYAPAVSRAIRNHEGEAVHDFRLLKETGLAGVVRTADGRPVAGASVALAGGWPGARPNVCVQNGEFLRQQGYNETKTDAEGRFQFPTPEGEFGLVVLSDAGLAIVPGPQFAAAHTVTVTPWGRVEGTLRLGGQPAAGDQVGLSLTDPPEALPKVSYDYSAKVDHAGRFALDRVPPTDGLIFRQMVTHRSPQGSFTMGMSHSQPIEVRSGETVRVSVGGTGRPVIGQVVAPEELKKKIDWGLGYNRLVLDFPGGRGLWEEMTADEQRAYAALSEAKRKALRDKERVYSLLVQPDGTFRVDDVPPGDYWLRIEAVDAKTDWRTGGGKLGKVVRRFTVPAPSAGWSAEPLDLGRLPLVPTAAPKPGAESSDPGGDGAVAPAAPPSAAIESTHPPDAKAGAGSWRIVPTGRGALRVHKFRFDETGDRPFGVAAYLLRQELAEPVDLAGQILIKGDRLVWQAQLATAARPEPQLQAVESDDPGSQQGAPTIEVPRGSGQLNEQGRVLWLVRWYDPAGKLLTTRGCLVRVTAEIPTGEAPDQPTEQEVREALQRFAAEGQGGAKAGAGSLDFRIAPEAASLEADELASCRGWLKAGRVGFWWKGERISGRMPEHAWLPIQGELPHVPHLVTGDYDGRKYLLVSDRPGEVMSSSAQGRDAWRLTAVAADKDSDGRPVIHIELDDRGAALFGPFTEKHVRKAVAVVVNGQVLSAPTLIARLSKTALITGRFTEQQVNDLVGRLRALVADNTPIPAPSEAQARQQEQAALRERYESLKTRPQCIHGSVELQGADLSQVRPVRLELYRTRGRGIGQRIGETALTTGGNFAFDAVEPGVYSVTCFERETLPGLRYRIVEVAAGQTVPEIEIKMPAGSIVVHLVDEKGADVAGAKMTVGKTDDPSGSEPRLFTFRTGTSDAAGRYEATHLTDGRYVVMAALGGAETSEVITLAPRARVEHPLRLAVAAPARAQATQAPWGEPVEGMQVRLRADRLQWKAGATPKLLTDFLNTNLLTDFLNRGQADLRLILAPEWWEMELDGQWYRVMGGMYLGLVDAKPLGPQATAEGLAVPLEERWGWKSREGDRPLVFAAGKHRVRVAFTVHPAKVNEGRPVRVVSNVLEIEILPAAAEPAGTPLERFRRAMSVDASNATQAEAIAAWESFLKLAGATPEQRYFATWRLASRWAYNFHAAGGEKADMDRATELFGQCRRMLSDRVAFEVVNTATQYSSLGGTPLEKAAHAAECYRWVRTRTEAMVAASAPRVSGDGRVVPVEDGGEESAAATVEERAARLRDLLRSAELELSGRVNDFILWCRAQDAAAVDLLLKEIQDVADPDRLAAWRSLRRSLDDLGPDDETLGQLASAWMPRAESQARPEVEALPWGAVKDGLQARLRLLPDAGRPAARVGGLVRFAVDLRNTTDVEKDLSLPAVRELRLYGEVKGNEIRLGHGLFFGSGPLTARKVSLPPGRTVTVTDGAFWIAEAVAGGMPAVAARPGKYRLSYDLIANLSSVSVKSNAVELEILPAEVKRDASAAGAEGKPIGDPQRPLEINDQQVREFYEKNPARFTLPEEVQVKQIIVPNLETANEARARAQAGEDVDALIAEYFVPYFATFTLAGKPGAPNKHLSCRGWTGRKDLAAGNINRLAVGEVSEPFQVGRDPEFYVAKITAQRNLGRLPLQDVADNAYACLCDRLVDRVVAGRKVGLRLGMSGQKFLATSVEAFRTLRKEGTAEDAAGAALLALRYANSGSNELPELEQFLRDAGLDLARYYRGAVNRALLQGGTPPDVALPRLAALEGGKAATFVIGQLAYREDETLVRTLGELKDPAATATLKKLRESERIHVEELSVGDELSIGVVYPIRIAAIRALAAMGVEAEGIRTSVGRRVSNAKPRASTTDGGNDAAWGQAVEGVQVRLRAEKREWTAGEQPQLNVDVRSRGMKSLGFLATAEDPIEIEIDGT